MFGKIDELTAKLDKPNAVYNHRKKRKWLIWGSSSVACLLVVIGVLWLVHSRDHGSLPAFVERTANFPLYYPSPLPSGYAYKQGSAKNDNNIVFYSLQKGNLTISVSEQASPPNPPDLAHIKGFTNFQTLAGSTALGASFGRPVAIVLSNTTLITITGSSYVPRSVVGNIARGMSSLPQ